MACVPMLPITNVYPSGGDLATRSAPMLPPAPPLFSTTTGCPHASVSLAAMARPKVSAIPPTANGTTILIGLVGYAWAWAAPANASAARAMPAAKVLRIMLCSSWLSSHRVREQRREVFPPDGARVGAGRVVGDRPLDHARDDVVRHAHGAQRRRQSDRGVEALDEGGEVLAGRGAHGAFERLHLGGGVRAVEAQHRGQ